MRVPEGILEVYFLRWGSEQRIEEHVFGFVNVLRGALTGWIGDDL